MPCTLQLRGPVPELPAWSLRSAAADYCCLLRDTPAMSEAPSHFSCLWTPSIACQALFVPAGSGGLLSEAVGSEGIGGRKYRKLLVGRPVPPLGSTQGGPHRVRQVVCVGCDGLAGDMGGAWSPNGKVVSCMPNVTFLQRGTLQYSTLHLIKIPSAP